MTTTSPTVLQRSIAFKLVRLRRAGGLTQADAARESGYSEGMISLLEKRKRKPRRDLVLALLRAYGAEDEYHWFDEQIRLLKRRDWWESLAGSTHPSGFEIYLGLEDGATSLNWWEPLLIPGVLQAPDYARHVLAPDPYGVAPDELEDRLQLRVRRHEILTRTSAPVNLWAITTEFALTNIEGSDESKQHQLEHLLDLLQLPNVHLQVIPHGVTVAHGSRGPFTLMQFDQPDDPGVVYIELDPRAVWFEDHTDIETYRQVWHHLQSGAAGTKQSGALIEKHLKEVKR